MLLPSYPVGTFSIKALTNLFTALPEHRQTRKKNTRPLNALNFKKFFNLKKYFSYTH
jgi:hypothetical protein